MNGNEMPEKFGLMSRVNIHIRIMLRLLIYSWSKPLMPFNFINSSEVNFGLVGGGFNSHGKSDQLLVAVCLENLLGDVLRYHA